ncbi:MAG: sodium:solute symporter family protein [Aquificaceae bacterium]
MLASLIGLYLILTLGVGLFASLLIKNSRDYLLAGRNLPLYMATFVSFATWFGSETILGASSAMAKDGLYGVIEDPFGAALCLLLVGIFFAKPLYRLNLLTMGDFYRSVFGRKVEIVASLMMVFSYFGWIGAQMLAIGIILQIVLGISQPLAITIGFGVVLIYTFMGGMWAISITDFFQTIVIIIGLIVALYEVSSGFSTIQQTLASQPPEYYRFFPEPSLKEFLLYISAWITIGLGSIPQQDVFQRVMSSRNERIASLSASLGGIMYLTIGLIPLILAIYAKELYPELLESDPEMLIPKLIMEHSSVFVKVLFFGALISAIMSTASSATLAPASVLSENILRPLLPEISDRQFLWLTRFCVVIVSLISLGFAFLGDSIYNLVASSSALSLVSLFVPLVAGLYLKSRNSNAALGSIVAGFSLWVFFEYALKSEFALLIGLGSSTIAYAFVATFWRQKNGRN